MRMLPTKLRRMLKEILYASGALSWYHRVRNRRHLTVVMFHRVLAENDPRLASADPAWTVSERLFEECLAFFTKHYNVISMDDLSRAQLGQIHLADRPLLITFDDGWADNADYALKALQERKLPAVIFVVAGNVGKREPWDERLRHRWRRGTLQPHMGFLWAEMKRNGGTSTTTDLEELIRTMVPLDAAEREELLGKLPAEPKGLPPPMLSASDLKALAAGRVAIGSHGLTHTPIPQANNTQFELRESRQRLEAFLKGTPQESVTSLSFPHGIHDQWTIENAKNEGYNLLFTSEPFLNSLDRFPDSPAVLGRISVSTETAAGQGADNICSARLACWLFVRNRR